MGRTSMNRISATSGMKPRQHRAGLRPLQRDQTTIQHLHLAGPAQRRLQVRHVLRPPRGVDHEEQVVATIGEHQVVEDAAGAVGEEPVALPAFGKAEHVHRHQRLQRRRRILQPA